MQTSLFKAGKCPTDMQVRVTVQYRTRPPGPGTGSLAMHLTGQANTQAHADASTQDAQQHQPVPAQTLLHGELAQDGELRGATKVLP